VGRRAPSDDADQLAIDLTEPASTDPQTLLTRFERGEQGASRMRVVFATYQSIDVVIQAQERGLPNFDLVICDEAHRTTGSPSRTRTSRRSSEYTTPTPSRRPSGST
jgi:predicted helicase